MKSIKKQIGIDDEELIRKYEKKFASEVGRGGCVAFASGRMAFYAAMCHLDIGEGDEVILSSDKGRMIRCAVKEIRSAGRNTQGVRIFKLSGEERVVSAIKIYE